MRTTKLGRLIVLECENLLRARIAETDGENRSPGIKLLADEFNRIPTKEAGFIYPAAWCGITVSVALERAFKEYDGSSTPLATARASNFVNLARKHGIRVDKEPAIGAIALTASSGGSGRHAQIVWNYEDGNVYTCEGNGDANKSYQIANDCIVKSNKAQSLHSRLKKASQFTDFIHIEEYFDKDVHEYAGSSAFSATSGLSDDGEVLRTSDGLEYCVWSLEEDEAGIERDGDAVTPPFKAELKSFIDKNRTELLLLGGVASLCLIAAFYRQ
jgi:surface antigen